MLRSPFSCLTSLFVCIIKSFSVNFHPVFTHKRRKEKMSDFLDANKLDREIRDCGCPGQGYWGVQIPSAKAGKFVERAVALRHESIVPIIKRLAFALPEDQYRSQHLTALFNKVVSIGTVPGNNLAQELFHANPDALAEPLITFVRENPTGGAQTRLLTDIFDPDTLRRDAVGCYPPESYDQKVQGLKRAAAGIDNLPTKPGVLSIVEDVITSYESERNARKKHGDLFFPDRLRVFAAS